MVTFEWPALDRLGDQPEAPHGLDPEFLHRLGDGGEAIGAPMVKVRLADLIAMLVPIGRSSPTLLSRQPKTRRAEIA